jgi:hypothetical protein
MVDDRRVPAEVDKHVRSRPSDRVALDACSSQSCSQTSREMLCAGISREASASGRMAGFVYLGDPVYAQAVIRCGLRPLVARRGRFCARGVLARQCTWESARW